MIGGNMKRTVFVILSFVWAAQLLIAQELPKGGPITRMDPLVENLFSPELLMQNQKMLALSEEQKNAVKKEIQAAQSKFTDVQWQIQSEMETMAGLLKQDRVDEKQALAQLDKVLNLEREMKKTQVTLMVRMKNQLSPDQQSMIRKLLYDRKEQRMRSEKEMKEKKDQERREEEK